MPHVEQDLLSLPEYLRSTLVFGGVRVANSLVFYVVSCVLLFVCLSFFIFSQALSVYFRFMSLTFPLGSFVPLLANIPGLNLIFTFVPLPSSNCAIFHLTCLINSRFNTFCFVLFKITVLIFNCLAIISHAGVALRWPIFPVYCSCKCLLFYVYIVLCLNYGRFVYFHLY